MEETMASGEVGATRQWERYKASLSPVLGVSVDVSGSCINIRGKYTVYHFSSHSNCIMISMQTQVSRGQGTKLSGSWKQLQWLPSLTMLGCLSYQKPLVHAS